MPNTRNVCEPITLLAHGRSGTSLMHRIFESHSQFDVIGESCELIFGTWGAIERTKGIIRGQYDNGVLVPFEERCIRGVRQVLITVCYSEHPRWMQKPIALPSTYPEGTIRTNVQLFGSLYWRVFKLVFPYARYFTILRNPCDVVISSKEYWGRSEKDTWKALSFIARILNHSGSLLEYGVVFDKLVKDPHSEINYLFTKFGLDVEDQIFDQFNLIHVPSKGRENIDPRKISRSNQWDLLDPKAVTQEDINAIASLWHRFNAEFEIPKHFIEFGLDIPQFPDNMSNRYRVSGYDHELAFWEKELSLKGRFSEYIKRSITSTQTRKENFPHWIMPYVEKVKKERPNEDLLIIDIGCGPLSMVAWGQEVGHFKLTAGDPLGKEYIIMLKRFGISFPVYPETCRGEELLLLYAPNSFHLAYSRNAFDHAQDPQQCLIQADAVLREGGYFFFSVVCNVGDKENYRGLHQFNFFTENGELKCTDRAGNSVLNLDSTRLQLIHIRPDNSSTGEWISAVFQKSKII